MSSLPHRTALMAVSLCLSLAWGDAHAQAAAVVFKFPREPGSLQLRDDPCRDAKIIRFYEGDVPEPFLSGTLDLKGRVLGGCWYEADGHIFFTDSEGDLLVPQPLIGAFVPAEALRQTTLTVSPAIPPAAGPRHIFPRPPPAGTAQ